MQLQATELKLGLSGNKWSVMNFCDVKCSDMIYVNLIYFEQKLSEVDYGEVLGDKTAMNNFWPFTDITWFYCDYSIWCVSRAVLVLTFFKMWVFIIWAVCECVGL